MKIVTGILFISFLSLSGCATYTTMMVNAKTGDVQQCRAAGAGLVYVALANMDHADCVKELETIGYKSSKK